MTQHEELRIFITIWIDEHASGRPCTMTTITTLLEQHLSIESIKRIGALITGDADFIAACFSKVHQPTVRCTHPIDSHAWWMWYAGWHTH